jgi:hypothetical protein
MELKSSRKYNTDFRKKLVAKFDNIKNKQNYYEIYNIITDDIGNNFSSNRNGIFVNMNLLSDKCIKKLIDLMDNKFNLSISYLDINANFSKDQTQILDFGSNSTSKINNEIKTNNIKINHKINNYQKNKVLI